jgi:hypothetical protein
MAAFGQGGVGGQPVSSSGKNRNAWRGEYTRGVAGQRKYRASGSAGAMGSGSQGTPYNPQSTPPAPLPVAAAYNASPQPFAAYAPASDTMYTGGTPNFNESTGQATPAPTPAPASDTTYTGSTPRLYPSDPVAAQPAPAYAPQTLAPSPAVSPAAAQPIQTQSQGTAYTPQGGSVSFTGGRFKVQAPAAKADPGFDDYLRSAGVMQNAATQSEAGYDRAVQKTRDYWNGLDAPNKQFQLERARSGQLGPGRLFERPDTARDNAASLAAHTLRMQEVDIQAGAGTPAEKAARIADVRSLQGGNRDTLIAQLTQEIGGREAAQAQQRNEEAARAAQWQQTRDQYTRPDGMSDGAFDYLVGQESAGQSRWRAPDRKVWMELMNRSLPEADAGGGYAAGGMQTLASEQRLYDDFIRGAAKPNDDILRLNGQGGWGPDWAPWKGRIQKKAL